MKSKKVPTVPSTTLPQAPDQGHPDPNVSEGLKSVNQLNERNFCPIGKDLATLLR